MAGYKDAAPSALRKNRLERTGGLVPAGAGRKGWLAAKT